MPRGLPSPGARLRSGGCGIEWSGPRDARIELRAQAPGGRWGPWAPASLIGHDGDGQGGAVSKALLFGEPVWTGPANRAQRLFALPSGQVVRYAWETGRGSRPVAVSMTAARRRVRGRWRCEVYAFAGVPAEGAVRRSQRARLLRQLSQRRFGIETSYRQMNQGKGRTTSPEPRRRLLWLGLALLLRQVWVWLQQRLAPRGTNWRHWRPPPQLRLAILLDWLATWMRQHYPAPRVIRAPQPLELPVAATVNR